MLSRRDFFMATGAAALGSASARPASKPPLAAARTEAQSSAPPAASPANTAALDMDPWATRIVTSTEESDRWEAWEQAIQAGQKYDLLIKGGTVIDPGQRLHAPL